MKDIISNKLSSFIATLNVADMPEFVSVWTGKAPLAFGEKLGQARQLTQALSGAGAKQGEPITGTAEALGLLREQMEKKLHLFCRAAFQMFTDLGRVEDAAKVDVTHTDFHRARGSALAGIGEVVLDLVEPLSVAPVGGGIAPGDKYGLTSERVAAMDTLWTNFSTAIGAPVGARSKRKAISDKLPAMAAAAEAKFAEADDLVGQFDETANGADFVHAWFAARKVAALGRHAAKPAVTTPPAPTP